MITIQEHLVKRKRQDSDILTSGHVIPSPAWEGLSYYPNISYIKDGSRAHKLDLYCPHTQGPLPVIINVHGDCVSGSKEYNRHFCMNLCKEGYAVFSVNYRLKPEASLADQIQDLADAAACVQKMSIEMKMQSQNLFMVGDQGGAMLIYYLLAVQNDPELAQLIEVQTEPVSVSAAAYISGPIYQKDYRQRLVSFGWTGKEQFRGYQFLKTDNPNLVDHQPHTLIFTSRGDDGYYSLTKLIGIFAEKEKCIRVSRFENRPDYYTGFCVEDPELPESLQVMREIDAFFRKRMSDKTY